MEASPKENFDAFLWVRALIQTVMETAQQDKKVAPKNGGYFPPLQLPKISRGLEAISTPQIANKFFSPSL